VVVQTSGAHMVIQRGRCVVVVNFGPDPLALDIAGPPRQVLFATSPNIAAGPVMHVPGASAVVLGD
jgi:hypothetical protein